MKRKCVSLEQIVAVLKQDEAEMPVAELIHHVGNGVPRMTVRGQRTGWPASCDRDELGAIGQAPQA